ncbi:hypothetical protein Clacol_008534 [Clathrus columnatus]|uniref:O-methyltransferase domain-containing protein n=1 Tax=Clathrus columnatus TaxID=1419009 RepID=A0AAV5AN62_9AGAM|nr:hypothetical protein Clacol_008534 [Clathrus columnatus]
MSTSENTLLSSGNAQVIALAKMISETADKIIKEYTAAGSSIPLLDSTDTGPFDSPSNIPSGLGRDLQIMEAACAQLNIMVNSPAHIIATYEEPACLQLVTRAKIADFLLDKPEGLHVTEIADKTSLDSGKVGRILRLLATKHCFKEVKPDVFANNRLSLQLVSTNPVSGLVGHLTDEVFKAGAHLSETLQDPKSGLLHSPEGAPFNKAHGVALFDFYETRLAQAMVGWGAVTGKSRISKAYPWDSVPQNSVICDIGGGNGHVSRELAKNFSNIRVIIQDIPTVITQAKQYWNEEYPEAVQEQRVEFIPIDFFKDTPAPGCQFYYLRHVLHDWPNAECIKILTNIRKVMTPTSRLLIDELVLQHAVRDQSIRENIDQAPEPLLANYGMGRLRLYEQDLNMMIIFNSKERTLQEFINLGEQTGFKYEKVWDAGTTGIIEFSII